MNFFSLALGLFFLFFSPALLNPAQGQTPVGNGLQLPPSSHELSLRWLGDSAGNRWEPLSALLLPVRWKGCPKTFYMQLDFGAPKTLFYAGKIREIQKKYPGSARLDSTGLRLIQPAFSVDGMPVSAGSLPMIEYGKEKINWSSSKNPEVIGTIGVDFIEDRVVRIDFPNQTLRTEAALESKLLPSTASDLVVANNSLLFPARVRNRPTLLFYDSGSSAFELLTDSLSYEEISLKNSPTQSYGVNSWGTILTANTRAANDSLVLGKSVLSLREVSFMQGASQSQIGRMMKLGIGGMVGNKLFRHSVLILDTKHKKFALQPSVSKKRRS